MSLTTTSPTWSSGPRAAMWFIRLRTPRHPMRTWSRVSLRKLAKASSWATLTPASRAHTAPAAAVSCTELHWRRMVTPTTRPTSERRMAMLHSATPPRRKATVPAATAACTTVRARWRAASTAMGMVDRTSSTPPRGSIQPRNRRATVRSARMAASASSAGRSGPADLGRLMRPYGRGSSVRPALAAQGGGGDGVGSGCRGRGQLDHRHLGDLGADLHRSMSTAEAYAGEGDEPVPGGGQGGDAAHGDGGAGTDGLADGAHDGSADRSRSEERHGVDGHHPAPHLGSRAQLQGRVGGGDERDAEGAHDGQRCQLGDKGGHDRADQHEGAETGGHGRQPPVAGVAPRGGDESTHHRAGTHQRV